VVLLHALHWALSPCASQQQVVTFKLFPSCWWAYKLPSCLLLVNLG
jgi:hypothetical protein